MNKPYELQIIDDSKFAISLEKVEFKNVGIPADLNDDDIKIRTKDSYKIINVTNDKVELEFKREKFFEPAALFAIEVVISISYKLKPTSKDEDRNKLIKEDINNERSRLLAPAATRASMIVSTLTSINLKVPMVDPPYFLEEDDYE